MKTAVSLTVGCDDLQLILLALGQLPYVQVHELIERVQREAGPQLMAAVQAGKENGRSDSPGVR